MFDVNDDAKGGFRRIEILTGRGRRRRWSAEEKARIVAETLEAGARVADVARRWQVCPQQCSDGGATRAMTVRSAALCRPVLPRWSLCRSLPRRHRRSCLRARLLW
jgi:hypothetical protein